MDVFGNGYRPVPLKEDMMRDYMFQVVVENSSVKGYFTEKIMDCFATGVVPIYWGCTNIGEFFNTDGILTFKNLTELQKILDSLSENYYSQLEEAIQDNFHRFRQYDLTEDWIADNVIPLIGKV